ncbi:hypothetical protein ACET3Z_012935 [Daucus carota]
MNDEYIIYPHDTCQVERRRSFENKEEIDNEIMKKMLQPGLRILFMAYMLRTCGYPSSLPAAEPHQSYNSEQYDPYQERGRFPRG